jgi:hypothetical protein
MKTSLSRLLAIALAVTGISIFQLTELHAATPLTGVCDQASCLSQETERQGSKPNQTPPQTLAFKIRIGIDCPRGFFWDGDGCVRERRHKRMGCPDGLRWNGDECVFKRKGKKKKGGGGCVAGFHWNGNKCVPDRQGQKKKKTKGNNDFPPIEGQEGGGGVTCSHNDHVENGRCVPCKKGFHVEGDECVAD